MSLLQKISIFVLLICLLAGSTVAQQQSVPGRVLFRISPEAIESFRAAFSSSISTDKHFDPQRCAVNDSKAISALLQLPTAVKVIALKPFVAQHNVVLEELREKGNPILFAQVKNVNRTYESETVHLLRVSEEQLSRWFELITDESIAPEVLSTILKKNDLVEAAEPRYKYSLCFTPNDSLYSQQYSLPLIHAPEAWDIQRCDSTMLVAVDDIGTDWTHIDLRNAIYINKGETGVDADGLDKRSNGVDDDGDGFIDDWHGWDFSGINNTAPDNDPYPGREHGTHTGGIMAASGNNRAGVCGVAFGAKLLAIKCGDNGGQDVSFGYEGIIYAADMGSKVVNNSWGGNTRSDVGQGIVNYATAKNCVVVAASGNNGIFEDFFPASFDNVLSVSSVDEDGSLSSFSNRGTHVDVCAPGGGVLSTVPNNGYARLSGTSMASPTAAGAIALIRQKYPNFEPAQAIEQLRVTGGAVTNNPFSEYTGGGLIDIAKAVGASAKHSARIVSVEIDDDDNDHQLTSSEGADIALSVRNYLDPIVNLQAQIEIVSGAEYISNFTPFIQFGNANTLDLIQNVVGSFHLTVAPNAPPNKVITVRVKFSSKPSNYGPDIDYFSFTINRSYLDLNKNNLTVTVDSKGGIGYNDPRGNAQGSGFVWTNSPPFILPQNKSVLSQAGLMIGIDTNHVVASAPGQYSDTYADQDFKTTSAAHYISQPDRPNAIQEIETFYNDSIAAADIQVGVSVRSRSYVFTEGTSSDAVVFDYMISKRVPENGIAPSDSTAIALFMDWDIGASGVANTTSVSSVDSSIFITKRIDPQYPIVGIKLISNIPSQSSQNFYALENDGSNGSYQTYYGFPKRAKWFTMTTPRPAAGPNDVSMIFGLKNVPLASSDSVQVTYVIALGGDENALKSSIDKTEQLWKGITLVHQIPASTFDLQCYPNPFSDIVHLNWINNNTQTSLITITDVLGRVVVSEQVMGNTVTLDLHSLSRGVYHLVLESNGKRSEQTLVAQ